MSDLNVTGNITINGKSVPLSSEICAFTSSHTLYNSTSLSTGNKTTNAQFSKYKVLAIGEFTTVTEGFAWQLLPLEIFKLYTSAGLYVQQNIASQDRRVKILYVDDTHFNIEYIDGANGLKIIGYK